MTLNKEILICITILFLTQIVIWFQLNGQLKWDWWKDNLWAVCLLGMPVSYLLFYATKIGYIGFGELWPVRMIAFAVGIATFPILTYLFLGEGITLKTFISIILSVIILLLQLI
tara:strand:- start:453 stop:794 length:342 start_codon:yes stop_codon:yes gene_type:complete